MGSCRQDLQVPLITMNSNDSNVSLSVVAVDQWLCGLWSGHDMPNIWHVEKDWKDMTRWSWEEENIQGDVKWNGTKDTAQRIWPLSGRPPLQPSNYGAKVHSHHSPRPSTQPGCEARFTSEVQTATCQREILQLSAMGCRIVD